MAGGREKKRVNQGQYLQYLGLCSARSTRRRGREARRKEEENILESVYKENENTHTPRLRSQRCSRAGGALGPPRRFQNR